jgi:hypothetical protein
VLGENISIKALSQELTKANLIISRGTEPSGRLPKKLAEKYEGRYYKMNLTALVNLLKSTYGPMALWGSPLRDVEL